MFSEGGYQATISTFVRLAGHDNDDEAKRMFSFFDKFGVRWDDNTQDPEDHLRRCHIAVYGGDDGGEGIELLVDITVRMMDEFAGTFPADGQHMLITVGAPARDVMRDRLDSLETLRTWCTTPVELIHTSRWAWSPGYVRKWLDNTYGKKGLAGVKAVLMLEDRGRRLIYDHCGGSRDMLLVADLPNDTPEGLIVRQKLHAASRESWSKSMAKKTPADEAKRMSKKAKSMAARGGYAAGDRYDGMILTAILAEHQKRQTEAIFTCRARNVALRPGKSLKGDGISTKERYIMLLRLDDKRASVNFYS